MVRIVSNKSGPRVYIAGRRCHHGTVGALGLLVPDRRVRAIAALMLWHDRKDFPFRDIDNH